MKKIFVKIVMAATLLPATPCHSAYAQVGINTTNPDTTALLDIRYAKGAAAVGVLLPNLNKQERDAKKSSVSDGMLVFDRQEKMLYCYDGDIGEWVALNPLGSVHTLNGLEDIRPQSSAANALNMSLGLPDNASATAKLDVNGSARVRGSLKVEGSDTVQQSLLVKGAATLRQSLQVDGNTTLQNPTTINSTLTVTSNIDAGSSTITAGTVNATYGTATVPVGGIIMWSGTLNSWPSNWALCDGANSTPDLKGRFIVSYSANDGDYNSVGKSGGEKLHRLTASEMPSHDHVMHAQGTIVNADGANVYLSRSANVNSYSGGGKDSFGTSRSIDTGMKTSSTGGGGAHENRPPYYVLAFIMRTY
jgi:microcystin-dependent protein